MPHVNDCIFSALSAYPGSLNEKILAWLQAGGATSSTLKDAWMEFLSAYSGSFDDRLRAWLLAQGAPAGSIADMWSAYWCGWLGPNVIEDSHFENWTGVETLGDWSYQSAHDVDTFVEENAQGMRMVGDDIFIRQDDSVVIGVTYRFDIEVISITGNLKTGDGTAGWNNIFPDISAPGKYSTEFTVLAGPTLFMGRLTTLDCIIRSYTARQVYPALY